MRGKSACGRRTIQLGISIVWLTLAVTTAAFGQGRGSYFNVESPQGHPVEVFTLGGDDYIAACNTRNNTLEIFTADETVPERHLATIHVGLEPVSVRFNVALSRLFVTNFLGDSVSSVYVSAPNGVNSFAYVMVETTKIGDEPMDIAFYRLGNRETIIVTHMGPDGFAWRDALTFDSLIPNEEIVAAVVGIDVDIDGTIETLPRAVKEPRAVRVVGDQLVIQALKGGEDDAAHIVPDLDLYCDDMTQLLATPTAVEGLGTTGFGMAFDSSGALFVVGADALNKELRDEPVVADAMTGFAKSMFYRIDGVCSGSPAIRGRDVNLKLNLFPMPLAPNPAPNEGQDGVDPLPDSEPVAPEDALSMLTDVVVYEDGLAVPKVFFTALGNDRVGVIRPDPAQPDPNQWALDRIDIPTTNGNPLAGPNGLALKLPNAGMANDPGARIYVLNHFDNSIATIDPVAETVVLDAALDLGHDPRPDYLTAGQRFLYDAKLSDNHFVSCATCHIYGRTDGLPWDLGAPDEGDIEIPVLLPDAINDTHWAADKEFMVTQSLQGLLNFELHPEEQTFTTNAPYHWRGDRATFLDFRPAFEKLLKGPELPEADMEAFEEFVNTIHYPPNPKEPRDRVASGDFGVGEDPDLDGSSGAQRGLKLYHVHPISKVLGFRSCATCHALPEGSNNRLTDGGGVETAALRGLFQKEAKRDTDGTSDPEVSPYTGFEGLLHPGKRGTTSNQLTNNMASINSFMQHFFKGSFCGGGQTTCTDLQAINQIVHELDWGVGPLVGCPLTIDRFNKASAYPGNPTAGCDAACGADVGATLDCMEEQAGRANSGLAVYGWDSGAQPGYTYDPIVGLYVDVSTGATIDRSGILDQIGGRDRYVWEPVPLGSERRVAASDGSPPDLPVAAAPSSIELLPLRPNTFYERVPELTAVMTDIDNTNLEGIFLHTLRLYQWGLIKEAANERGFGVGTALHHDAPRRFQLSGRGIRPGAILALSYQDDPDGGPPDPRLPVDQLKTGQLTLPLYPTDRVNPDTGDPVWETAVELEPLVYYALMLGGDHAPGVAAAYNDPAPFQFSMEDPTLDEPEDGAFDPVRWNWVYVAVMNIDGMLGDGGWQRLYVE